MHRHDGVVMHTFKVWKKKVWEKIETCVLYNAVVVSHTEKNVCNTRPPHISSYKNILSDSWVMGTIFCDIINLRLITQKYFHNFLYIRDFFWNRKFHKSKINKYQTNLKQDSVRTKENLQNWGSYKSTDYGYTKNPCLSRIHFAGVSFFCRILPKKAR